MLKATLNSTTGQIQQKIFAYFVVEVTGADCIFTSNKIYADWQSDF